MAAISAAVLACVGAGDRVVLPSDGYYTTRLLAARRAGAVRRARSTTCATPEIEAVAAAAASTASGWCFLETPSNPLLDVCDIAAVARAAHAAGAVVAVDNTTATPLGQRPLELGADLTVGSDTKALTGHSDLLLGHVSTTDDDLFARLQRWRNNTGNTPGPFEAWLGHRSMSTLDLRLARQAANAAAVAELLAGSPGGHRRPVAVAGRRTRRSRWPRRQMLRPERRGVRRAGRRGGRRDAARRGTRLWTAATSFGGVHSTIDRRAQWGGDAVAPGFVRLSCGIEDTADLVADLAAGARRPGVSAAGAPTVRYDAQPDVVDEVAEAERHHDRVRVGVLRRAARRR